MSAALATARRVLTQLGHDWQSLAMIVAVPGLLLLLLKYVLQGQPGAFDRIGLPLVGIFPLALMLLLASVSMLRERTSGALERLMTMPTSKLSVLIGYALAFGLLGLVQATVITVVALGPLGLTVDGPVALVLLMAAANSLLGLTLGLLVAAVTTTELQAEQTASALLLPQLALCGLFAPTDTLPRVLEGISRVLPMTYAYDGLTRVAADHVDSRTWTALAVIGISSLAALAAGAATLRRRTE